MPFQPEVDQELVVDNVTYRIAEHLAAPGMPYGQEGRQAIVYQLAAQDGAAQALKVFKSRYRLPALVGQADKIAPFAGLSGLQVCQRAVLTPQRHTALLRQQPDLTYAVLMPWVEGPTWMEVLVEPRALSPEESLALARSLAEILAGMEQNDLAHCDLSGPNVLMPGLLPSPSQGEGRGGEGGVALVDVEQLYGPDLRRPELLPGGSPGYAHKTAPDGLWGSTADRFAGAVLLGEMLGWCDERVREAAWGENYFDPQEMQRESERLQALVGVLEERWGTGVARLFERAWRSEVLADCATFGEWLVMLPEEVPAQEAPSVSVAIEEPGLGRRGAAEDALRVLMDLGRQFEEQGQLESALQTYRRACELAPAGGGLAKELALIVQDLEGKQREATVPESPPLPVEEVVGTGTPIRPLAEEAEAEIVPAEPQPSPEEAMAAEAETAAPLPELPLEEAAVEPVALAPGSALEEELALIAEGVRAKPQEEAPPLELRPPVVEAEAEVTVPPAGEETDLDRLFDDGLAAYERGEWAKTKELLREVVRRQPVYERDGYEAARTLLAEAERRLAPARRKRVSGWAWALLGLVFVIAWIIYSNYQAERRALVEALKATALAQYQATVTVQAQATATTRAQATAQAQAAVADSCNPSADQVALFVDANYGGQCVVKGVGQYSNPSAIGLPNDSITSIRVGSNVQATLYEHDDYQGRSETFTSGDSSLRDNTISDDAVSSVKVQWRTSAVEITATAQAQDRATAQARAAATVQARATATVQARATAAITAAEVTGTPRQMTTIADSSPCSDIIMVGSADAKVYKIDIGTEKIIEKTTLSNIQMGLLAWNQTRNEVYGADYNGDVVSIVQPDPLREIGSIRQNVGWNAYSIAVSPDGSVMYLTFSWGGDNASYRQAVVLDPVARVSVGKVRLTDTYGEAYLALSSDGKYLYVSWDSNIDVYSTSDMSLIQHNTLAAGWSGRLAVSSDDRYLYICQADQLVKWNIGTGTTEEIISLPGVSGYSWIEMSDDGQRVWVGSSNANRVYEVQTSFANYRAIDLQGIPYSFVQSSDGLCLYSTSFEEGVSAVDLSTGEIVRAIPNIQYATGLIVVSYERQ